MAFTTLNGVQLQIPTRGTRNWDAVMLATTWANIASHDHTGNPKGNQLAAGALANNAVTSAKFRQSVALSVVGNSTNATANVADIAASVDGQVLRRSGTALEFALLQDANIAASGVANIARNKLATATANTFATNNASGVLSATAVTASRAVVTDANGLPSASGVTTTQLSTALAAYEQNVFTPAFSPATGAYSGLVYVIQSGSYQVIGNRLHFDLCLTISACNLNTASGNLQITGLPIALKTLTNYEVSFPVETSNYNIPTGRTQISARLASGSSTLLIVSSGDAVTESIAQADEITGGAFNKKVQIVGSYPIS